MKKPIKAVMTEYIDDNNQWSWYEVTQNETPRQAIIRYSLQSDETIPTIKKIKSYEIAGCEKGEYWIAEEVEVRAFYITIK